MPHSVSQTFLSDLDKKLWTATDRLRSNLDVPVYKHAVLGLIVRRLLWITPFEAEPRLEVAE